MSEKDRALLGTGTVIENGGVDLRRASRRRPGSGRKKHVLFIGSFRHFPNIVAFRFLTEEILPLAPAVNLTVVAGPDARLHWTSYTGQFQAPDKILEFVEDVRPLYHQANIVVVPTLESAGTNVKVLEAMAMQRAVVSTSSGCAGLGRRTSTSTSGSADTPAAFADGIETLLKRSAASRENQRGRWTQACRTAIRLAIHRPPPTCSVS